MNEEMEQVIRQLSSYVCGLIADKDLAQDVVQETLFRALARGKSITQDAGWLFRVARNEAWRTLKKRHITLPEISLPAPPQYREEHVADYLHSLPCEQRYILQMRYFNHSSIKEISRLLQKPEGTIKRRLHAARASLKKEIYMAEKKTPPSIKITPVAQPQASRLQKAGQGLLMGNPGLPIGDTEFTHYYEYPGRVYAYASKTTVTRTMELNGSSVVEVVNSYEGRSGERQRRMYYMVTDAELKMVMRIFEWDKGGIEVQTDPNELVRSESRWLELGQCSNGTQIEEIDVVDLMIDEAEYLHCFRVRSSCVDYHGKELNEAYYNAEGREVLHRSYIGDDWRMGGFVTWEMLADSQEMSFHNEKYRLWVETVVLKTWQAKQDAENSA
jgi:RNA polymerase sigma-70 factor (ECF subfamily)